MTRFAAAVGLALLVASPLLAQAPPAGHWKYQIREDDQVITFLFAFSQSDGKWVGDFLGSSVPLQREPKFSTVAVKDNVLSFTLTFGGREFIVFDGLVAKDGKSIRGSASQFGGPLRLTELYPSKLKKLDDPVALARETLEQAESGAEVAEAAFTILSKAAEKKVPVEEVRGVVDRLTKSASAYGPRWERSVAVRIASTLADQPDLADVAVAQARRAERMLADDSPVGVQMEVIAALARSLQKSGKADEAKKYTAALQRLEARDYEEYAKTAMGFEPQKFAGRKAQSERAVLVELFTGAECPPCVASDLAFDGLLQTYQPKDVVFLQYHFHVPAPDPLTSPDGMERVATYADAIRGAPTVMVNGKALEGGGGPAAAAKERYTAYREAIDKQLETPSAVRLTLAVTPGEKGGYTAKATVSDLENPGDRVVLRFALVEERVRFAGGNGIRFHHQVVRAMPGGAKGFPLKMKTHEQTVTIEPIEELRSRLTRYLDEYEKTEGGFPRSDRPLNLADLRLVAFIQNDATGEVLQAVQVELK